MKIGIPDNSRAKVADALQKVLANQHLLYQKLRNFHWNVKGKVFFGLHTLFEDFYTALAEDIDVVAERIQSLGYNAKGTYEEYLKLAVIRQEPGKYPNSEAMVKTLLEDTETLIRMLRETAEIAADNGDAATEGMLTELVEKHEKQAWMLRSTA